MASIPSNFNVPFPAFCTLNENRKLLHTPVLVRNCAGSENAVRVTPETVRVSGGSYDCRKKGVQDVPEELKPLWDDGYGTRTVKDFVEVAMDLIRNDGGPPRWFCPVACGLPIKDSPVLLYLPGIDGTGAALTLHEKALGNGNDNFMPSKNEAQRLSRLLQKCNVRVFEGHEHMILLESGFNLLSVIKTTQIYRHSSKFDIFKDFLPTSITEFKNSPMQSWWYRLYTGVALFSTMEDGKIVRGLAGIPDKGPVLVVGNHMLWGFDAFSIVLEFLREKKITLHGLAHPEIYRIRVEDEFIMIPYTDAVKILGAIPISARNLFRLLSRNSYALMYPGGARESLHRKGEDCKLFWPDKQEFVRMAVKLGATIIPYGGVGDDDIAELLIDFNDMEKIPFLDQMVKDYNQGRKNLREGMKGEISKQQIHIPIVLPKLPGRIYFLFGKPIQTKGKEHMSHDKDYLCELYTQIKCDVEKNMAYLLNKREDDPYRGLIKRLVWLMNYGSLEQIPSFEP